MKIVMLLQVGNEVELIDANIAYHFSLGIDAMIVVDLFSIDGTREKLKRYEADPRVLIRYVSREELVDEHGIKTLELSSWMLQTAREQFAADWVVRLDADEFLFPANGQLHASLQAYQDQSVLELQRRNAIFAASGDTQPIPLNWLQLSQQSIVAKPYATNYLDFETHSSTPLILTRVGPKLLVKTPPAQAYGPGAHQVFDAQQQKVAQHPCTEILLVHFWFTTLTRFRHKAKILRQIEALMRKQHDPGIAWQWSRWSKLDDENTENDAVAQEFARQFPEPSHFQELQQGGIICAAQDYWQDPA